MSKETEVPKRYAFNMDSEELQVILGLPDGYPSKVRKAIEHAGIDHNKTSDMLEDVMNRMQPKNTVEAAYIGYCFGIWTHMQYQKNEALKMFDGLLGMLRENDED